MHRVHRAARVLFFPAIAYLAAACERTETPTEARRPTVTFDLSNDPTTRWVNAAATAPIPPGTSCSNPGYRTIQDAVDHAVTGDRINVCPGTYMEQVTIPAGKNNIRLRSTKQWAAVIQAPSLMLDAKAIVRVNGAQGVSILAFTITGPGGGPCHSIEYGVRVDEEGTADILGNHITKIRDEPFSGCQNGVAVLVGRAAEVTTGSARIMGNVIDDYQKNGPTIDNTDSHAEIVNNRILGHGPTAVTAQNGIQVSRGATAQIRQNFVSGNVYTPQAVEATGILLYQSGAVVTDHNTVTSNDAGIYMFEAATGSTTPNNQVRGSTFDGITLDDATGNNVANNKADENNGPGIGVYDGSQNNSIDNNDVEGNHDSGILVDDGAGNSVGGNHVRSNGTADMGADMTDGIRVNLSSAGNTIHDNHLRDNVTHDCHDGSLGTANTWVNNHGETENAPGLCTRDPADDATVDASIVYGWDPSYPWYDGLDVPSDYDWAAAYATIDTASLLQLLPQVRLGGVHRPIVSPNQ